MESVLVALIVIALVLFSILTLANTALVAQSALAKDWQAMQEVSNARAATRLMISDVQAQYGTVDVTIQNDGNAGLADFDEWDLILQYYAAAGLPDRVGALRHRPL